MKPLRRILVTAGPTREMLDPVRFLSNVSTGEMGYAIARAAKKAGSEVTLISGPTHLTPPRGVSFVPVVSASDMKKACARYFPKSDLLVMTAAVCDFTAAHQNAQKIRRTKTKKLQLVQTPDILAGLGRRKGKRVVVGFCLETQDWLANAKRKLARKHLDGIVANYYTRTHIPFGRRKITTALVDGRGRIRMLRNKPKAQIASVLLRWAKTLR